MVRVRLVTTPIWSQSHLLQALAQVGFAGAESHDHPVPLTSWRGIPLGGEANVVVRREQIGAAGDDFGFVRNTRGSFDAVISEIHFFRFDRRWLEDLARRHDELALADGHSPPSSLPDWSKRELGAVPVIPPAPGSPPALARGTRAEAQQEHHSARARIEAAGALDDLRQKQKKSTSSGCIVSLFAPFIAWIILSRIEPSLRTPGGFFGVVVPLVMGLAIVSAVQAGRRARDVARRLQQRLPSNAEAQQAARAFLEAKVKPAGAKNEDSLVKDLLRALRDTQEKT